MIGGDPAIADEVTEVFDALFARRFQVGKIGDGGRAKLAVNLILGLNRLAWPRVSSLPSGSGSIRRPFSTVARGSASYSQVMETKGPKMLSGDFSPEGRAKQTLKDVHLMLDQAAGVGQKLAMLEVHADGAGSLRTRRRSRFGQQRHHQGSPAPRRETSSVTAAQLWEVAAAKGSRPWTTKISTSAA